MSSDSLQDLRTLTLQELADATGIQPWRLREMIAKGQAPAYFKVGRVFRFPVLGVRRWLAEMTSGEGVR